MRRTILLCILGLVNVLTFAQTYLISNSNAVTTCSGSFYDSGGSNSDYQANENYIKTFTASTPGQELKFDFTQFDVGIDTLFIYQGADTNAPLIGGFMGVIPGPFAMSSCGGSMTFRFGSGSDVNTPWWEAQAGWRANISCYTPTLSIATINDTTICRGSSITLFSEATGGDSNNYNYSWQPYGTLQCRFCPSPIITSSQTTTTYVVSVVDGLECARDTVTISVANCTTAIGEPVALNLLQAFPNPSTGLVYVTMQENLFTPISIEVHSMVGERVYMKSFHSPMSSWVVDLSNASAGNYILKLICNGEPIIRRIVINKE